MTKTKIRNRLMLTAALGAAVLMTQGCSSSQSTIDQIYEDPTPMLDTSGRTGFEINNRLVINRETNFRMVLDDLGRAMLLNRPSRLTPRPVGY